MKWPPLLKCPYCKGALPDTEVLRRPLVCPTCSAELQFSKRQARLYGYIALGITVALCYVFGLRGVWLFAATIVFWFPFLIMWIFLSVRIFTTRFERYVPR